MNKKTFYCTIESIVYSAVIYILFFHFNNLKEDFLIMNLHPLVVMVGFLALKYGVYIGFISSIMAIITYILAYISLGNDIFLFFFKFEYYKFFLIFLFIDILLGKIKLNFEEQKEKITEEKIEFENKYEDQKRKNTELIIINNKLKNQIINSRESLITLYKIKRSLRDKTVEQLYTEIMIIFKEFLNCDTASVYKIVEKNNLRSILKLGNSNMPSFILFESEIGDRFKEVVKSKVPMEFSVDLDDKQPVYISPVYIKGELSGFINIEKLNFNVKERYTFEMFKIVSEELEDALELIFEKMKVEHKEYFYDETGNIVKWDYFNTIVEECERRKNLFETNYLLFEAKKLKLSSQEIIEIIKDKIWGNDYITFNDEYIRFLFTMTDLSRKENLKSKIESYFDGVEFYEI